MPQTDDERMRKFQYLVDRYEINREFATRLRGLEGYEIVFIVDGKRRRLDSKGTRVFPCFDSI